MSKFWIRNGSRDRKHDSSRVSPPPADFTGSGMEYGRDRRRSYMSRKPLHLQFDHGTTELRTRSSSRSNDTIALHDAAIKSATSLMGVKNDCSDSPQPSAHLLAAKQHSAGAKPMFGRPRSHTAASTPVIEVPGKEPAELEGSTPIWPQSATRQFLDVNGARCAAAVGQAIVRPHSSPQDISYKMPSFPQHGIGRHMSNTDLSNALRLEAQCSPFQSGRARSAANIDLSGETLVVTEHECLADISGSSTTEVHGSGVNSTYRTEARPPQAKSQPPTQTRKSSEEGARNLPMPDHGGMMHIIAMRASHEAHLASLKEAHDKEIAFHRAYIRLLEYQRRASQVSQLDDICGKEHLTLDTTRTAARNSGTVYSDKSATASVQSFEQSHQSEQRTSAEMAAELKALKRKLSLCRRLQADLGDVRGERDALREIAAKNDRRISQLKDIVRKAKENEKTLKSRMQGLEASLVTANMERVDVLEGFHLACAQVDRLTERESKLVAEKDAHIQRLQTTTITPNHIDQPTRDNFQPLVNKYEQPTAALKAECDQYNAQNMEGPLRPFTPLGKHKKLPRPPPKSTTPSPHTGTLPRVSTLQRPETLRSLSESIISSNAKRGTPKLEVHNVPPVPTTGGIK